MHAVMKTNGTHQSVCSVEQCPLLTFGSSRVLELEIRSCGRHCVLRRIAWQALESQKGLLWRHQVGGQSEIARCPR